MSYYKDQFEKQIKLIKNEKLAQWVRQSLGLAPEYYFTGPASSTGKYHPACTIGPGGLVIHVKRAVYFADRFCSGLGVSERERDQIISAVILHDIAKTGRGTGSFADYENHPINAIKYFAELPVQLWSDKDLEILSEDIQVISGCVQHHMGLWTPASIKKEIGKYSVQELIVYMADYTSSTKDLVSPVDGG